MVRWVQTASSEIHASIPDIISGTIVSNLEYVFLTDGDDKKSDVTDEELWYRFTHGLEVTDENCKNIILSLIFGIFARARTVMTLKTSLEILLLLITWIYYIYCARRLVFESFSF